MLRLWLQVQQFPKDMMARGEPEQAILDWSSAAVTSSLALWPNAGPNEWNTFRASSPCLVCIMYGRHTASAARGSAAYGGHALQRRDSSGERLDTRHDENEPKCPAS